MDITYLLWLQNLRLSFGKGTENFFSFITDIPFNPLTVLLICTIYWCMEKRLGLFILFSQSIGTFVNNIIKNCVCAYRPWIRDRRINPPPRAQAGATGYSFPSGHTQAVVGEFGTLGYALCRKDMEQKNHRWLWAVILCAVVILIVAFSRNFLSVHTPQDVLVALCVGALFVWISDLILRWEARGTEGKKRDVLIVLSGTVIIASASAFVLLKNYPVNYINGNIVVDPADMKNDFFGGAGSFCAVLWGWLIEKRWIKFSTECSAGLKILRGLAGALGVAIIFVLTSLLLKPAMHSLYAYYFIKYFMLYIWVTAAYPAVFSIIHKKIRKDE